MSRLWTVSVPSPAFVGVTVEEVGVAALLEDGGHLLGLVVVQLDLAITLIMTPALTSLNFFSESPGARSAWNCKKYLEKELLMPVWQYTVVYSHLADENDNYYK